MGVFRKATEVGTAGAMTLAARYFLSADVFAEEQQKIFSRHWLCAGREEALPGPGDWYLVSLGRYSVIVLRDAEGSLRAFHNVCRHRGTRLCEGTRGRFSRTIQCPYHAWTYSLDGTLLGAPSMDQLPDFERSDYPLHDVPVALWEGFVFLSLSEPLAPFAESHRPVVGRFGRFQLPQLRTQRTIEYDVQANWKLIVQNYSECYHCPSVHPALVKLSPAESGQNDLTQGPFLGGFMAVTQPRGSMTLSGRACARPVSDLPDEDRQRVYYYSLFPNMLLSLHSDFVMYHTLWPSAPDRTRIMCSWLFHPQAAEDADFRPEDGIQFWDMTNRQDWHICEQSQAGIASPAYVPGPYSPRDSISAAFDREYLRQLE
jgi:Rieske 2Fe-2S family protein